MAHAEDIDWVAAQSKCNVVTFFEQLKDGIKRDVERRNSLSDHPDRATFEYFEEDDGSVEVTRSDASAGGSPRVVAAVRFRRQGRRIEVMGEDIDVMLHALVSLDPEGHCRVVIGEALFAEWELRRMALEQLFFHEEALEED